MPVFKPYIESFFQPHSIKFILQYSNQNHNVRGRQAIEETWMVSAHIAVFTRSETGRTSSIDPASTLNLYNYIFCGDFLYYCISHQDVRMTGSMSVTTTNQPVFYISYSQTIILYAAISQTSAPLPTLSGLCSKG